MTNPYYNDENAVQPSGTARSAPVINEYAKLETAFDSVDTQLERRIKIPADAASEIVGNAAARALKGVGFDANGDVALLSALGTWRGDWTDATAYASQDIVRDPASPYSLYIATGAHTSEAPFDSGEKTDHWELIIDLTELARAEEVKFNWTVAVADVNPAVTGTDYAVDTTSGAITITLPASPANNDHIRVMHVGGDVADLVIARNGNEIQGAAENLTFSNSGDNDATGCAFALCYINSTYGWRVFPV